MYEHFLMVSYLLPSVYGTTDLARRSDGPNFLANILSQKIGWRALVSSFKPLRIGSLYSLLTIKPTTRTAPSSSSSIYTTTCLVFPSEPNFTQAAPNLSTSDKEIQNNGLWRIHKSIRTVPIMGAVIGIHGSCGRCRFEQLGQCGEFSGSAWRSKAF
jgi:hypothetical protein